MRTRLLLGAATALALVTTSCSNEGTVAPGIVAMPRLAAVALPDVRISEIHYDDASTDSGEAIEVSAPAGTNLAGWSLVRYNGSNGQSYGTTSLTGTISESCDGRGVVVINFPVDGLQNGSPDGVALINPSNQVVEFLSYEGTFAATNGIASGMTSVDIGVAELGEPEGQSLKRSGTGLWSGPSPSNFGTCNDNDGTPVDVASVSVEPTTATLLVGATRQLTATARAANGDAIPGAPITWSSSSTAVATVSATGLVTAVAAGDVTITATSATNASATASAAIHVDVPSGGPLADVKLSEIHYDNNSTDAGEAIEVTGPAGTNLAGWSIVLYNGSGGAAYGTLPLSGVIADQCSGRGTVFVAGPASGIQNGNPDGFALVGPGDQVVEFLSYGGTFAATSGPANGRTSTDIGRAESGSTPIGQSLQRASNGSWFGPTASSFGSCNADVPPPPPQFIRFSGREASEPALPIGFEDQLFTELVIDGVETPSTFTWISETPDIASVDARGVIRAIGVGTAVFRATAADGTTRTYSLPTRVPTMSGTAQYGHNTEFGEPADGNPGDDLLIRRAQYTSSFNTARGIPNWVAYNIDATHFGSEDRCECFTYDPELPAAGRYTTADYTGAGAFHGYGIDRGHLARSFDRTAGSLDNAMTFYFANIIPQASDNNQGPWAAFENYLGNRARDDNREVFVIAGASGAKGTVKNEGKITIPAVTWKVAVIMPRDQGLANVRSPDDLEVIAVVLPNDAGIRNTAWETFKTTVDVIEDVSGYDLLALLRNDIELAVESNTQKPSAATTGPFTVTEGGTVTVSGASSSDPDAGQSLSYAWSFGDGGTATGVAPSHVYTQDGSYTIRLIVTDNVGLTDTVTTTAAVSNVAPSIATYAGATLLPGESYAATGSFADAGADSWTATVDYGDGSGQQSLALAGKSFTLAHTYAAAGSYTVTVRVTDDDVTSSRTATVTVLTPLQGVESVVALVQGYVTAGTLTEANAKMLLGKLENAAKHLGMEQLNPSINQLLESLHELTKMVERGELSTADADAARALVERLLATLR